MVVIATEDSLLFDILQGEIESEGCAVSWALNGQEAQELCEGGEALGLLVDVGVGVISVFELCSLLRNDPDIPLDFPIVVLSDDEVSARKREQFRVQEVFPKTHAAVDVRELLSRMGLSA